MNGPIGERFVWNTLDGVHEPDPSLRKSLQPKIDGGNSWNFINLISSISESVHSQHPNFCPFAVRIPEESQVLR